jgi:regulator of sirC expression with transglutaminase-like and TPR domain
MIFSSARRYFYLEVQQPDEYIDLARAALYIAQEEYPTLDPEEYLNVLDTMAVELEERLPVERYPMRVIQTINQYLYGELGFSGNKENYYDPRNSFLNDVIERRLGIPISLATVYLELARRINFPMVGIGMPGHFLIRPDIPNMEIFVDVFDDGEILFLQDCQEKLSQIYQQPVKLQPEFLPKVTTSQILARMLSNLKYIYLKQQELEKALAAVERILLVFPDTTLELRDRGLIFYQLGQFSQAVTDLEAYLIKSPEADDLPAIRRLLMQMGKGQ